MTRVLTPYRTRVRCRDCGHEFTIRKHKLQLCPHCWNKNLEIIGDLSPKRPSPPKPKPPMKTTPKRVKKQEQKPAATVFDELRHRIRQ